MTPRTFWAILLKMLGLYVIVQLLTSIPTFLYSIYELRVFSIQFQPQINGIGNGPTASYDFDKLGLILQLTYNIGLILVYILILYNCLFKTERVINKLKLAEGFDDERFEFNLHRSTILKIIIMVTGGLLLIENIPQFFKVLLSYINGIRVERFKEFVDSPDAKYIVMHLIEIFIGYFMLTCSRMIVNYLELKRKKIST